MGIGHWASDTERSRSVEEPSSFFLLPSSFFLLPSSFFLRIRIRIRIRNKKAALKSC
ncbi:MAG: hypothetical protein QQW96_04375 [Tychonema bourrellyi B0820]|nr:hypothetical protein [Tychonema bourrellyi B0820]